MGLIKPIFFLFLLVSMSAKAQYGCTDPQANNFNPSATINDGSCTYNVTNLSLTARANINTPLLDENSGIEFSNNKIWTHNDGGNTNQIFRIDSLSNAVLQTVTISNATNIDWEDITSSKDFIFIGDIGNNSGNRTNLKIYKIDKNNLSDTTSSITAEIINYSYSDQTSFVSALNNNNFDCEALLFYNDSLHLFSKNWVDKKSKHYVLPSNAGTYTAQLLETINAGYLVTGAAVQEGGVIALCGYDNTGVAPIFLYMLYDYKNGLFFNGNKRRFNLSNALTNGQIEGVDFKNGAYGYVSNERFQQSIFNVAPKLKSFDLTPYLPASFVYPKPKANFVANETSICKGKTINFTDKSSPTATGWQWLFPGGNPATSSLQNPTVQYKTSGSFSVTLIASNANGNDTLVFQNYIEVKKQPTATLNAIGSTIFCTGGSVVLNANTGNGYLYQWKRDGKVISGAVSSSFTAVSSGNYMAIVTNSDGCSKASNAVLVTGPPAAAIVAAGPLTFCAGDSVVLNAATNGSGFSYQWLKSNVPIVSAINQSYSVKDAGYYRVNVTNNFGCSVVSNSKKVTVNCRHFDKPIEEELYTVNPNPSFSEFTFSLNNHVAKDLIITVSSIYGNVVEKLHLYENSKNITFGNAYEKGVYLVSFETKSKLNTFLIVKQ